MKKSAVAVIAAASLALASCATLTADVQKATNYLASPTTAQALANVKAGATIFVCAVAQADALAGSLEPALSAGQSITGTTGKVLTVSGAVCSALQGASAGTITAQSGQSVAVSTTSVTTVQ